MALGGVGPWPGQHREWGVDYRGKGVTCSHAALPEGGVELKKVILGRSHHRGSTGVQVHSPKRNDHARKLSNHSKAGLDLRGGGTSGLAEGSEPRKANFLGSSDFVPT